METFYFILLGTVQGLTEFLPISSSGHLVLFQKLIPGFSQPGILLDVFLHLGTLAAVFYFYKTKIFSLSKNYLVFLVIGTVPAIIAGLMFRESIENMFSNPKFLGFEFLVTAIINFLVDSKVNIRNKLNIKNSLTIGVAQAIAIIPAVSRSGATILAGVKSGLSKEKAAEFSFLLSVPAILGANLLEIFAHRETIASEFSLNYILGFVASFVFGLLSISWVIKFLKENKFKLFGFYSLVLGILIILFF